MEIAYPVGIDYFLWSLLTGAVLALLYDILRAVRKMTGGSGFSVNTEDILFFLLAGISMFVLAFYKNSGQLRWQGFLGTIAGFVIYRCIFKNFMIAVMVRFYSFIIRIVTGILKAVFMPVQLICKILKKPFVVVGWYTRQRVRKAEGAMRVRAERRKMQKKCQKTAKEKRRAEQKREKLQKRRKKLPQDE